MPKNIGKNFEILFSKQGKTRDGDANRAFHWMGNAIPFRRTYRFMGSVSHGARRDQKGCTRVYSHGAFHGDNLGCYK